MFLCNVKGLTLHRTWAGVLGHNREAVHPYINGGSTGILLIQLESVLRVGDLRKKRRPTTVVESSLKIYGRSFDVLLMLLVLNCATSPCLEDCSGIADV